jgi:hypothetical protein
MIDPWIKENKTHESNLYGFGLGGITERGS